MSSLQDIIKSNINADVNKLALQRSRYHELSDTDFLFMLEQIEGRQATKNKLPEIHSIDGWLFPKKLSIEQSSSQDTAILKREIIDNFLPSSERKLLVDLTAGMGIDLFYLSSLFEQSVYVEQQEYLCELAKHNFSLTNKNVSVFNCSAQTYIEGLESCSLIYIDPARRAANGKRVYSIEDCEPNLLDIIDLCKSKTRFLVAKLSPMLDIKSVLAKVRNIQHLYIISTDNEVKELLIIIDFSLTALDINAVPITTINLKKGLEKEVFSFSFEEENLYSVSPITAQTFEQYIYEPNSALMKGGAYNTISKRYDIPKLDNNSHLYTSDKLLNDFQGRIFKTISIVSSAKEVKKMRYSCIARNYPLSAAEIKSKYQLSESDTNFLIATRIQNKPIILKTIRIK